MPAYMIQLYSAWIQLQLKTVVFILLLSLQTRHPPL